MLTTLSKVKSWLGISVNTYDALLTDLIHQATAFIQTACGGRVFEAADYVEICDLPDGENVFLNNYPIILLPNTGNFTVEQMLSPANDFLITASNIAPLGGNSPVLNFYDYNTGAFIDGFSPNNAQPFPWSFFNETGTPIPDGKYHIVQFTSAIAPTDYATDITLPEYDSDTEITFPPIKVEYRTGTISNPTWVAYTRDDYYIYEREGYLSFATQFYSGDFQGDLQALRVSYRGGYLIDWANEYDPKKHTLPADLTSLATSLVVSMYNRKSTGGIKSESTEGQSIDYGSASDTGALNENQKAVIARYMRHNV